jgi:hypothetical protein
LIYSSVTALSTPANGTVVVNADGTVTYTPRTGFTGTPFWNNSKAALFRDGDRA